MSGTRLSLLFSFLISQSLMTISDGMIREIQRSPDTIKAAAILVLLAVMAPFCLIVLLLVTPNLKRKSYWYDHQTRMLNCSHLLSWCCGKDYRPLKSSKPAVGSWLLAQRQTVLGQLMSLLGNTMELKLHVLWWTLKLEAPLNRCR